MIVFSIDLGFMTLTQQDVPMLVNFCVAILIASVGLYHLLRRDRGKDE